MRAYLSPTMPSSGRPSRLLSRRQTLAAMLGGLGVSVVGDLGCGDSGGEWAPPAPSLPKEIPETGGRVPSSLRYADNVDALCDVLIPAERDHVGQIVSPGARETSPGKILRIEGLEELGDAFRVVLNGDLDALALLQRPLTPFRDLPRKLQEAVVRNAFADPARRPAMLVMRAACFTAYLGAASSDVGLRAIGYPPFENFADGLAVSGYPRTRSGRLIDASTEDLAALEAAGDLDDYTYNRAPAPTPGDDLLGVLDTDGDLL